jgi:hypothetical protein
MKKIQAKKSEILYNKEQLIQELLSLENTDNIVPEIEIVRIVQKLEKCKDTPKSEICEVLAKVYPKFGSVFMGHMYSWYKIVK